jgi:hypothetical protein
MVGDKPVCLNQLSWPGLRKIMLVDGCLGAFKDFFSGVHLVWQGICYRLDCKYFFGWKMTILYLTGRPVPG